MKIINNTPFKTEAIPYKGPDGETFVTLIVKGTFSIANGKGAEPADDQLPIAYGDEPFNDADGGSLKFEADIAPFKPRADIVMIGHAYAPAGTAVAAIDVSLKVGSLHRVLRVFGDRQWQYGTLMPDQATDPKAFTKMPIVYERAFGGVDMASGHFCRENLVGTGLCGRPTKKTVHDKPLPNIEDPRSLIASPKDHPKPVGFGFYGRAWHPRVAFLGSYDDHWRKTRAPYPPADFRYDYYNAAHPNLQVDGYLAGHETVELMNLSKDHATLCFQLPGIRLSCSARKSYDTLAAYLLSQGEKPENLTAIRSLDPQIEAVQMHLDTLCLMPDDECFFMLWRGRTPTYDLTGLEIQSFEVV